MKILMLSGDRSLAAGKRGAFYYLLEELSKYCERIDILCPEFHTKTQKHKNTVFFDNVYIHPSDFGVLRQPWFIKKKGVELYNEHKHDIVLIHEYPPFYNSLGARLLRKKIDANSGEIGSLSSPSHGVKFVVEIHHIIGYPRRADLRESFYLWLSKIMIPRDCKRFDAVRVVNEKQVPELLEKWEVDKRKLYYASSMYIDLDVFKPMNLEKKYDLVFAGRLVKNKNVKMLIEAVKILRDKGRDLKCVIVGEGHEIENLKSKVKSFKLEKNVEFLGWLPTVEDVAKVYNQSKLFVMPSLNEGGPRVCLEAMACGVPVVTTRVGIMLDIIKDGENGFFCDWNAEDMAEKILETRNKETEKLRGESVGTATQFERKKMIKNLAEVYQRIVDKS